MPTLAAKRLAADLKQAERDTRLTEAKTDQIRGGERRANVELFGSIAGVVVSVALAAWGVHAHWFEPRTGIELLAGGSFISIASRFRPGGTKKET